MVKKTNNSSTPDATKSTNKKFDDGNRQPRKSRHRKGNNYKKTISQSTFVDGTKELGTDTFTYGATVGNDCVNSKEAVIA